MENKEIFIKAGYKIDGNVYMSRHCIENWLIDPKRKTFRRTVNSKSWPHSWTKEERSIAKAAPKTYKTMEDFIHIHREK